VQFAGVEQQLKTNEELTSLITLQQTAQSTAGAGLCRQDRGGRRQHGEPDPRFGDLGCQRSQRRQLESHDHQQHRADRLQQHLLGRGRRQSAICWNGKGTDGTQWPDGKYTLSATATDSNGQTVGVATRVPGTVSSVDLTQTPPLLTINGQTYTINQVKAIVS